MSESNEAEEKEDFFETIFRLDECGDVTEFLEFVQATRHDTKKMLSAVSQLLAEGRLRSAYILSMLLVKRGQKDLPMSIALSAGGVIFGSATEEKSGLRYLQSQVDALSLERQRETYDRFLAPVMPSLMACVAENMEKKPNKEPLPAVLRAFKAAVPSGFDWMDKKCPVCCAAANYIFHADLCKRHRVAYYICKECDFLFTEKPYWLPEVYGGALAIPDDDSVARSLRFRQFVSLFLRNLFDQKGKFLDYGGGYGLFVRLMRDEGFDFYWQDKYCQNLFAHGFEGSTDERYELVTAFECFQHFVDPMQELEQIFERSDCLLFTTRLVSDSVPQPDEWDYYALESGQHISFYSKKSLRKMAKSLGLVFLSNGTDTHMFTRRNLSNKVFDGVSHWQP